MPVSTQAPKQSTASATGKKKPLTIGATPTFAGQERAVASRMTGVDTMPAYGDIAMMFGSTPPARTWLAY